MSYAEAKKVYEMWGVDTDAAIEKLKEKAEIINEGKPSRLTNKAKTAHISRPTIDSDAK